MKKTRVIGTTTASGAFYTGIDITIYDIVCARLVDTVNVFAFPRNDAYLMCICVVDTSISTYGNCPVVIDVWYSEK